MEKAETTNLVNYLRNGFGAVRPYLYGPANYASFIREVFDATEMEEHDGRAYSSSNRRFSIVD